MAFLFILSVFNRENTGKLLRLKGSNFGKNLPTINGNKVFGGLTFLALIQEQGINRELGTLVGVRTDFWIIWVTHALYSARALPQMEIAAS